MVLNGRQELNEVDPEIDSGIPSGGIRESLSGVVLGSRAD
jgi:hypothetical protein